MTRYLQFVYRCAGHGIAACTLAWACHAAIATESLRREVAVTIDDLPTIAIANPGESGHLALTEGLLEALVSREIPAIGFVNESKLYDGDRLLDDRVELLRLWLAAGLELGNHTYSHPDLHRVSLEEFQSDVLHGEEVTRELLAEYNRQPRYFRHPFLHTGQSLDVKHGLEAFLATRGYRVAPVSIDNSEWIFARAYVLAMEAGEPALPTRVGEDYVEYMLSMFEFYEDQSMQLFDRNIAHVLLVHANSLNGDYVGRLADRLTARGYRFVSPDEALEDEAYRSADRYTGPGGITWIHRWALTQDVDPAMFRGEPTAPDYVLELAGLAEHSYQGQE
jgi:peptidoglycan/xylan/chitin deacetylase (PgdA/CDA1 family)